MVAQFCEYIRPTKLYTFNGRLYNTQITPQSSYQKKLKENE